MSWLRTMLFNGNFNDRCEETENNFLWKHWIYITPNELLGYSDNVQWESGMIAEQNETNKISRRHRSSGFQAVCASSMMLRIMLVSLIRWFALRNTSALLQWSDSKNEIILVGYRRTSAEGARVLLEKGLQSGREVLRVAHKLALLAFERLSVGLRANVRSHERHGVQQVLNRASNFPDRWQLKSYTCNSHKFVGAVNLN